MLFFLGHRDNFIYAYVYVFIEILESPPNFHLLKAEDVFDYILFSDYHVYPIYLIIKMDFLAGLDFVHKLLYFY